MLFGRVPGASSAVRRVLPLAIVSAWAIVLVSAGIASAGPSAWTGSGSPPTGAYVWDIRSQTVGSAHKLVIACDTDGVFVSSDEASNWAEPAAGIDGTETRDAAMLPTGAMMAATTHGLYLLPTGGTQWQSLANSATNGAEMEAVIPLANGTWLAGAFTGSPSRIFKVSADGTTITTPTADVGGQVWSLYSVGTTLCAGTFRNGLWMSSDGGDHWVQSTGGIPVGAQVNCFADSGGSIYAGCDAGLYQSTDGGGTWTLIGPGNTVGLAIESGGAIDAAVWMSGLYRSTNGGAITSDSGMSSFRPNAMAQIGDHLFMGYRGNGVFKNVDPGTAAWVSANTGLLDVVPKVIGFGPNGVAFADGSVPSGDGAGVFMSADNNSSWQPVTEPLFSSYDINGFTHVPSGGLLVYSDDGAYVTTDSATWTRIGQSGMSGGALSLYSVGISPDGTVTAGGYYQEIYVMHEGDDSWYEMPLTGFSSESYVKAVAVASDGSILAAADGDPNIYRWAPGASSWVAASVPGASHVRRMLVGPDGSIYASATNYAGLYTSADNGQTWSPVPGTLPHGVADFAMDATGTLFASVPLHGVYRSDDEGASWRAIGAGSIGSNLDLRGIDCSASGTKLLLATAEGTKEYTFAAPTLTLGPAVSGNWVRGPQVTLTRDFGETTWVSIDSGPWLDSSLTTTSFPLTDGPHTVLDYAVADVTTSTVQTWTIDVDSVPPFGSASLAKGPFADPLGFALSPSVVDTGCGLGDLRTSADGGTTWSAWQPVAASVRVVVPGGDGVKTVLVQARDAVGNMLALSATATFKRTAPTFAKPKVSPTSPKHGKTFALTGVVNANVGGKTTVSIYRKKGAKWVLAKRLSLANVSKGAGAAYSAKLKLSTKGKYYAIASWGGSGAYASAKSSKRTFTLK